MKPIPTRAHYIETIRRMTPSQRLDRSFKLTERKRALLRITLKASNPALTEEQLNKLVALRWLEMSEDTPPELIAYMKKHYYQIS